MCVALRATCRARKSTSTIVSTLFKITLMRKTRNLYNMIDVNVYQENIFHTKMMLKDFDLDNYLFGITEAELSEREIKQIKHQLRQEMTEIFYGRNLPSVKA